MFARDSGGAQRLILGIAVRDRDGVLRHCQALQVRDRDNVLRSAWQADAVSGITASRDQASKTASTTGGQSRLVTTNTITITGAAPGSTYSWALTDGDSRVTATAPTADATAFSATIAADEEVNATFVCTITQPGSAVARIEMPVTLHLVDTSNIGIQL